jgi:myo-inositol-1(or 4)-monophosphatase
VVEWESVLREAAERVQKTRDGYVAAHSGTEKLGPGAGGDQTMAVDRDAEKDILETIKQMGSVNVVSEEVGEIKNNGARWTVVVDPLDGSSNFERQIPYYCTSIAVIEGQALKDARYALVRNLVNGDVYYAEKGGAATKNGQEIKTNPTQELGEAMVGMDLSKTSQDVIKELLPLMISVRRQMHFGANALEICFLADGRLDAFIDVREKMRIWDLAGAYLIAQRAGAVFTTGRGMELAPAISVSERFTVAGSANTTLHNKILEKLTGASCECY